MGLRVLYVAGWSSPHNLETDSTVSWVRGFVLPWIEARPDVFLHVTVPGGPFESQSRAALKDLLEHPRIRPVWTLGDDRRQYREMTQWQPELDRFDDLRGEYPWIDVVLTDRPAALPMMVIRTESYVSHGGWRRVYVVSNQFLFDQVSTPYLSPTLRRAQSYGWAEADITMWHGEDHRNRAIREARQWLSSDQVAKVRERSRLYLGGLQFEQVMPHARTVAERQGGPPTLVWGTAINRAYMPQEILEEYDRLYATGHPVRVRVMTSSRLPEDNHRLREMLPERYMTWMEWYAQLPQVSFWKLASEGHVFVAGAKKSELSYGWSELAMLGLVGVYQDKPEIRATVVPGWPYWWSNDGELRTWLRHLLIDGEWAGSEAQTWVERQRAFLLDMFAGSSNWPRLDADVRSLEAIPNPEKAGIRELIERCTADVDELTLDQFSRRLAAYSKFGRRLEQVNEGRYGQGKSVYRKVLLRLGWSDVCDTETPRFVRVT